MKNLRKPRQVTPANEAAPKKARSKTKKAKKPKTKSIEQVKFTGPDEIDEVLNKIDLKGQLTIREVRFIELRFVEGMTTDKAMIAAGYGNYSQKQRYRIATKIVQKYESQGGDHQKIMRAMGYGEVRVIELLIEAATKFKSEAVRLNARIALAKALGLQKEVIDGVQGVKIIINAANGESIKVGVCVPASPSHEFPQAISIKD
jgi:hypothetical protein